MPDLTIKVAPDKTLLLRGLAILAVLVIHIQAYLPKIYDSPQVLLYIALDQFCRFCVPLFVILSGYGLAKRYGTQHIHLKSFFKRRALKLLPPYILWSLVTYCMIYAIPEWRSFQKPTSLILQLLLGQVDYQLYFMVLIFQLYMIFPFLLYALRRWPTLSMILACGTQLGLSLWYSGIVFPGTLPKWFETDSNQYLFFASWIGYFAIAIWISYKRLPSWLIRSFPLLAVGFFGLAVFSASQAIIQQRVDPLIALRTTRWPIMLYATSFCLWLMTFRRSLPSVTVHSHIYQVLSWLGKYSYLIFLAHTLALRLLFAVYAQQLVWWVVGLATAVWLCTLYITQKYLSE